MGLPRGSVRAILALAVVVATLAAFLLQLAIPDGILAIAGMVITFYFTQRANEEPAPEPLAAPVSEAP